MATRKKPAAAKTAPVPSAAPGTVLLHAPDLGETRPFAPDHAQRLLQRGTWQAVAAPAPTE